MESNPYSAPRSQIGTSQESMGLEIAGKGRCFGTFFFDYIISLVFMIFVDFMIVIMIGVTVRPEGTKDSGA
jgi:hypothetical protein